MRVLNNRPGLTPGVQVEAVQPAPSPNYLLVILLESGTQKVKTRPCLGAWEAFPPQLGPALGTQLQACADSAGPQGCLGTGETCSLLERRPFGDWGTAGATHSAGPQVVWPDWKLVLSQMLLEITRQLFSLSVLS